MSGPSPRRAPSRRTTGATRGGVVSLALLFGAGCGVFGGVRVETLEHSVQKPSNVAVFMSVTDHGEPVTNLEPKNFRVYEDGQELSAGLIERTLLPRESVTAERVLLLVDLSGNPGAAERASYVEAVEAFVRKLTPSTPVAVRAFDGSPGLRIVGDYPRGTQAPSAAALAKLTTHDASRDLNGAVVSGLAELDRAAQSDRKPIHVDTLVVFARGPDLAGRTERGKLDEALDATKHDVIGIGIGRDTPHVDFARAA